jgi:hypothetical protein
MEKNKSKNEERGWQSNCKRSYCDFHYWFLCLLITLYFRIHHYKANITTLRVTKYFSVLLLKLQLNYDRQSVGQSILVSWCLGPSTNFSFSLKFPLDSCGFVILYCPLWREDGSVIYCTTASGSCQISHSWVEVPQNSRPYFTVSSETM